MKKQFFSLIAGAVIALTSCSQSDELTTQTQQGGDQPATFQVGGPASTRTTVGGLNRYIVEAYESKDLTATPERVESATGSLTLTLKKNTEYTFLFWADGGTAKTETTASSGHWNTADLKAVTVSESEKSQAGVAAYCLAVSFNSKDFEANKTVTLKNATAQVNFIESAGLATTGNTLTVKYVAGAILNVGTGAVTEAAGGVSHTFSDIAQAAKDAILATDYVLAPLAEQSVMNLKVQLNAEPEKAIDNVPFQQSYKTNIKGEYSNLYASTFTISNEVDNYTEEDFSPEPANIFSYNTQEKAPTTGDGTEKNPFLIESAANIKWMQTHAIGYEKKDKHYRLETDIEVTTYTWDPIGGPSEWFYGHFDGNNHKITGTLTASDEYFGPSFGFFSVIGNNASISNLTNSAEVKAPNVIQVGGIAGYIYNTSKPIKNCHNTAKITGKYTVGGICGALRCVITSTTAPVTLIQDCDNSGSIIALDKDVNSDKNSSAAGGIAGDVYLQPGTTPFTFIFSNCTNSGAISAPTGGEYVGGIIGKPRITEGTCKIKDCTNTGTVKAGEAVPTENIGTAENGLLGKLVGGKYANYSAGEIVIE